MELVKELTGWVDKVRMTVSGTEATMHAMRIARALHRPRSHREVRGPVPRTSTDYALISVAPDIMSELGDPTTRPVPRPWPGAVASPTPLPTRSSRRATTTSRRCASCSRPVARRSRRSSSKPVLGNDQGIMPKAWLPPGDARADRGVRDPADLRRGQDRVPLRQGRRGPSSSGSPHPESRDVRQGDGQTATRPQRSAAAMEVMSVLPDKVSHGGTYAGNRSPRGRSQDTVDHPRHGRPRRHPRHGPARPGWSPPRSSTRPGCRTTSRAIRACSGSCSPDVEASEYRDWATTDHELYDAIAVGMHARGAIAGARLARTVVLLRGARRGDIVDRIVTIFFGFARCGPRGPHARRDRPRNPVARCHIRRQVERAGRMSSTATPSDRSIGQRRSCSRSARARARPASPSWLAGSGCTSPPPRVCWPRSRSAASSSRRRDRQVPPRAGRDPATQSGRNGHLTCAGSRCPSSSASRA